MHHQSIYKDSKTTQSRQHWTVNNHRQYRSLEEYINRLLMQRSRLLVVRVDLGFSFGQRGQYDAEYARNCFRDFLNRRRHNHIFHSEMGYVWSLEYGREKGFHYHCIFLFDGHLRQDHVAIGNMIGVNWCECTGGTGNYHCSNNDIERLEQLGYPIGIGMIHRNQPESCARLVDTATYLIKQQEANAPSLHAVLPETSRGFRTFGRGEL